MSYHCAGLVRLLEELDFIIGEGFAPDLASLVQPIQVTEADNGHGSLGNDPGQGDLAHLPTLFVGQLLDAADDLIVGVTQCVERRALGRFFAGGGSRSRGSCEEAAIERGPRDQANAGLQAVGVHFAFFFAVA